MSHPPETVRLDFRPARDGFSFSNHFLWHEEDLRYLAERMRPLLGLGGGLATMLGTRAFLGKWGSGVLGTSVAVAAVSGTLDRLVSRVARQWPSFGLCGGMALAVSEWWEMPGNLSACELQKEAVLPLLRMRQERTLRRALPRFLGHWVRAQLNPAYATVQAVDSELDTIQRRLAGGRPVVLGLVGDAPDPFAMHQVVCFGIERSNSDATARLAVYDPNSPGEERWIQTVPSDSTGGVDITTNMTTGPPDRRPGQASKTRKGLPVPWPTRQTGHYHISRTPGRLAMVFVVQ